MGDIITDTMVAQMRGEIALFAQDMEDAMAENDKEKGDSWKRMGLNDLAHLGCNQMELFQNGMIYRETRADQPEFDLELKKRLLNISNYCMMLYYRLGEK